MEGMEHDSAMKKPGEPDMHACSCCFFLGFGFSQALFFSCLSSGHWWRPHWPLSTLEAWRYLKSHLFAILNSECIRRSMEPHGKGDLSIFFSHLFALSNLLFSFFFFSFLNIFFHLFQLFWHEQHIFFSNVP